SFLFSHDHVPNLINCLKRLRCLHDSQHL
ncbi:uncharacterized protein METZ01_LOCUS471602, partial [marine metagenome]